MLSQGLWIILVICFFGNLHAAAFGPPVDISPSGLVTTNSRVTISDSGYSVAVWNQVASPYNVQGAFLPSCNGQWILTDMLLVPGNQQMPEVGIDAENNAIVVDATLVQILAAKLPSNSANWIPTSDVSSPAPAALLPQIAVNNTGKAVTVWLENVDGTHFNVRAAVLDAGGSTWTDIPPLPQALSTLGFQANTPVVALDEAGNAIALWTEFDGSFDIVRGAILPNGATHWTYTTNLSLPGGEAASPEIAVDGTGNAVAVWMRSNGTNQIIQGAILPIGSTIWIPTNDLSLVGQDALDPQLDVDPVSGKAVAVWSRFNGSTFVVQGAILLQDVPIWMPTSDLSDPMLNGITPQVAMDSRGHAIATWIWGDGTMNLVQASFLKAGSATWTALPNITPFGSGDFMYDHPHIDISSNGDSAVCVWGVGTGHHAFGVQASTICGLFPPDSPSNFLGKVKRNTFLTQTDVIHSLTWEPSPQANAYLLYRNGLLIATIPANAPLSYEDHNRGNSQDTYVLYAIDQKGQRSEGVTIQVP